MIHCPLFVELCAGTAALSLKLHVGKHARPPVSRMGAKTGYAHAILRVLGLRQGQGQADGTKFLLCEPDDGVRLMLHAYTDRELAQEAARIIRSWKDEEPRALWERLRAEGPARCPPVGAREVARWLNIQGWDMGQKNPGFRHPYGGKSASGRSSGSGCDGLTSDGLARRTEAATGLPATITDDARKVDPREVARWVHLTCQAYDTAKAGRQGWAAGGCFLYAHKESGELRYPPEGTARRIEAATALPATITDDARKVDPREVARLHLLGSWAYRKSEPDSGYDRLGVEGRPKTATDNGSNPRTAAQEADIMAAVPCLPAAVGDDARNISPHRLPAGTVAYIDPPYQDTTGYAHAFPRSEWLPIVRAWADAGATVCVSEAEPIPDLVAEGWHAVDITGTRKGQRRTFGGTREWLTVNTEPAWRPSVQRDLFSGVAPVSTGRE